MKLKSELGCERSVIYGSSIRKKELFADCFRHYCQEGFLHLKIEVGYYHTQCANGHLRWRGLASCTVMKGTLSKFSCCNSAVFYFIHVHSREGGITIKKAHFVMLLTKVSSLRITLSSRNNK